MSKDKEIVYEIAIDVKIVEDTIAKIAKIFAENELTVEQGLGITKIMEGRILELLRKELKKDIEVKEGSNLWTH